VARYTGELPRIFLNFGLNVAMVDDFGHFFSPTDRLSSGFSPARSTSQDPQPCQLTDPLQFTSTGLILLFLIYWIAMVLSFHRFLLDKGYSFTPGHSFSSFRERPLTLRQHPTLFSSKDTKLGSASLWTIGHCWLQIFCMSSSSTFHNETSS
jgi:hypothetical protein